MAEIIPPWTLKNIPSNVRDASKAAASQMDMTLGKWVAETLWKQSQEDLKSSSDPDGDPEASSRPSLGLAMSLAERVALARQLLEAAGKPPAKVRKAMWRMVRRLIET
jgi:hypothetical protein